MIIDNSILKKIYPPRKTDAKKYDHGSVLVIGGSEIYSGSPVLSGLAALRAGADIVQIAAPQRAADVIAGFTPDLISYKLPGVHLAEEHLAKLLEITELSKRAARENFAVVIGGGVGRSDETQALIRAYVKSVDVPLVIDADGIYAFENEGEEFLDSACLFTPHLYEFYVLTKIKIDEIDLKEREEVVKQQAAMMGITIALKGATDIVSDGQEIRKNETAVPELTTGGCGDVLAGLAGLMLARTKKPIEAASGAVFLNTEVGKIVAAQKGESLIASDLIESLPEVIKNIN